MKSKRILTISIFLLLLSLGLAACGPYTFNGTVLQSPDPAPNFSLSAAGGETVSVLDFRGKIVVLYFGYTFCPDVCPATMAQLGVAMNKLGKDAEDVQVIMVSVDPTRDTPEKLADYVTHFNPSFIGVTGTDEQIAEVAALYGVFYEAHEGTVATGYLVDHTASLLVLDREGRLKLIWPFGTTGEQIAADLKHMLK